MWLVIFLCKFILACLSGCLAVIILLLWNSSSHSAKSAAKLKNHKDAAARGASRDIGSSWTSSVGRYKHCMLRPEPFAPRPPPSYSLVNIDLPLPALAPGEEVGLEALTKSVADLTAAGRRTDRMTLLRFLRARKGDVGAAEAYLRKSICYRDQLSLHQMDSHHTLAAYEHCFAPWWVRGGIVGHSLQGGIVGFDRFGVSCFPELLDMLPFETFQKLDAIHMVRTLAAFEEDSILRGVPYDKAILVLDLKGLDAKYCRPRVARAYGKIVEGRDMLMPNTLKHVFLINAPRIFSTAWSMCRHVIDSTTRDKVQIVSGDAASLKLLQQYMSDDVIPAYLGGRLRIEGDPECRPILGAAGAVQVPQVAVDRLLDLVNGVGSINAKDLVNRGGSMNAKETELSMHAKDGRRSCCGCIAG